MSHLRNKGLLSDVLAEESDAGFREALLSQTLHLARRRRQFRKARQLAGASAIVGCVVLIAFHFLTSRPVLPQTQEQPYQLVTTRPLPASEIVSTVRDASVGLIASSTAVELVTKSHSSGIIHELDDEELLAVLPSPALLVRRGPHLADLVFADPKAEQELLRN